MKMATPEISASKLQRLPSTDTECPMSSSHTPCRSLRCTLRASRRASIKASTHDLSAAATCALRAPTSAARVAACLSNPAACTLRSSLSASSSAAWVAACSPRAAACRTAASFSALLRCLYSARMRCSQGLRFLRLALARTRCWILIAAMIRSLQHTKVRWIFVAATIRSLRHTKVRWIFVAATTRSLRRTKARWIVHAG
mmetsp:Transcript_22211/g.43771  ORF Transcript_22211/g.43771 Transcript_22211/m.43771 type:complete len:200 (+) Transcript_22211:538-1137(+)